MTKHPLFAALVLVAAAGPVDAGSFTYRGQLKEDGVAANGRYDLQLQLYADPAGTRPLAAPIALADVAVKDGQFAVAVELPELLADTAWLEVSVRPEGEYAYWPLGAKAAVALKGAVCPAAWELGGNAGTVSTANFLGTTDNQPLELRTANTRSLRIEPSSALFNGSPITTNLVGGSQGNAVAPGVRGGTIAGGGVPSSDSDPLYLFDGPNRVTAHYGFVGGGFNNRAGAGGAPEDGPFAFVGGGIQNVASGEESVVSGGDGNTASGIAAAVGGGQRNSATDAGATITGGTFNLATGLVSSVGGGNSNTAQGLASTVPGGISNCAGGDYSFAGGRFAKVAPAFQSGSLGACANGIVYSGVAHHGTFVWADSQNQPFQSSAADQFVVRSQGGVAINAAPISDAVELSVVADADDSDTANLFLRQRSNSAGILFSSTGASSTAANDAGFFIDHFNGSAQARRLALNSDGSVVIRSNVTAANTGVSMAAGSGAWSNLSDRNVKTAISAVDPGAILDRLVSIPISEWSYIAQGEGIRHLGPMAQDFAAAFGLGENATTISSIDADGVALAAIQGLNSKLERENAALRATVERLAAEMTALRGAVEALRANQER